MTVCGRYVKTFAEASHALPQGMHMNADYPFMIPAITKIEGDQVTISGSLGATETFTIESTSSSPTDRLAVWYGDR